MSPLWALAVPVLSVAFGAKDTWVGKPHAKIQVVAKGPITPELVRLHVVELKEAAIMLLKSRGALLPIDDNNLSVDIKRTLLSDDERASIDTSIIMSMTAGAVTAMY